MSNCYKCKYRWSVPGNTHSCCRHPKVLKIGQFECFTALVLLNKSPFQITANPHGVKNGWFMWPLNFDPVWLESCEGFTNITNEEQPKGETK